LNTGASVAWPGFRGAHRPICGHSGFWVRPEFNAAMKTLGNQLTPEGVKIDTTAIAPPTAEIV
jgi:hypothetical protein